MIKPDELTETLKQMTTGLSLKSPVFPISLKDEDEMVNLVFTFQDTDDRAHIAIGERGGMSEYFVIDLAFAKKLKELDVFFRFAGKADFYRKNPICLYQGQRYTLFGLMVKTIIGRDDAEDDLLYLPTKVCSHDVLSQNVTINTAAQFAAETSIQHMKHRYHRVIPEKHFVRVGRMPMFVPSQQIDETMIPKEESEHNFKLWDYVYNHGLVLPDKDIKAVFDEMSLQKFIGLGLAHDLAFSVMPIHMKSFAALTTPYGGRHLVSVKLDFNGDMLLNSMRIPNFIIPQILRVPHTSSSEYVWYLPLDGGVAQDWAISEIGMGSEIGNLLEEIVKRDAALGFKIETRR